jgi:hypothetical protein
MTKHNFVTLAIIALALTLVFPLTVTAQTGSSQTVTESSWVDKAPLPTARAYAGAAAVDGKIYVVGGRTERIPTYGFGANEMYDPATDSWTQKAPMPSQRGLFGITVFEGKIYCIGGESYNHPGTETVGTVEVYNPTTDTWETKAQMPTARLRPQLNVVHGKIYALGGIGTPNVNEAYDPATDAWTTKTGIPSSSAPDIYTGVSTAFNNQIYWFTKEGNGVNLQLHARLYNPAKNTWTELPPPANATDTSGFYFATSLGSERIYLLGSAANITYFDPATGHCAMEPKVFPARIAYAAAAVNGSCYIIGGSEQFLTDTAKNQQYTPLTTALNTDVTNTANVTPTVWFEDTVAIVEVVAAIVACLAVLLVYVKMNRH